MPLNELVYCVAVAFKMTEQVEQWICIKFCIKLEHSSVETIQWFGRPQLWATGDWQLLQDNTSIHASCVISCTVLWWSIKSPRWLGPPIAQTWCLQFMAFSKTEIIFEREDISDHQWDLGKHDRTADGNWENCVRSQGDYFEGDWGVIVLCTMFLVSWIFFNKCLYFS